MEMGFHKNVDGESSAVWIPGSQTRAIPWLEWRYLRRPSNNSLWRTTWPTRRSLSLPYPEPRFTRYSQSARQQWEYSSRVCAASLDKETLTKNKYKHGLKKSRVRQRIMVKLLISAITNCTNGKFKFKLVWVLHLGCIPTDKDTKCDPTLFLGPTELRGKHLPVSMWPVHLLQVGELTVFLSFH